MPVGAALIVIVGLVSALIWFATQMQESQTANQKTATALMQIANRSTDTPKPTATIDIKVAATLQAQATIDQRYVQSLTETKVIGDVQKTQDAEATRIALTPTNTPTNTLTPTPTRRLTPIFSPTPPATLRPSDYLLTEGGITLTAENGTSQSARSSATYRKVNVSDVIISVDISITTTGQRHLAGLSIFCRFSNNQNFYEFGMVNTGAFFLSKVKNGLRSSLVDWKGSGAISKGSNVNNVRLVCVGNNLQAFVNEQIVASETDNDLPYGTQVGIEAITWQNEQTTVKFDNWVVVRATESPSTK